MFPRTNFKQPYETNICTTNILKPFTHQKNVQRKTFIIAFDANSITLLFFRSNFKTLCSLNMRNNNNSR